MCCLACKRVEQKAYTSKEIIKPITTHYNSTNFYVNYWLVNNLQILTILNYCSELLKKLLKSKLVCKQIRIKVNNNGYTI